MEKGKERLSALQVPETHFPLQARFRWKTVCASSMGSFILSAFSKMASNNRAYDGNGTSFPMLVVGLSGFLWKQSDFLPEQGVDPTHPKPHQRVHDEIAEEGEVSRKQWFHRHKQGDACDADEVAEHLLQK